MAEKILYIGTLVNTEIEEHYNFEYHSRAGNNKKRGIIKSLQSKNVDVTVLSPVFVNNNSFRYYSGQTMTDEDLGTECYIPPTLDVYGLNYFFLGIITTIYAVLLLLRNNYEATLFYDIQVETAVPALFGRLITATPMVLEYEDGLFLHDNSVIRFSAKILRPITDRFLDGAVCVNKPLESLLRTENTTIVRGFPSVGMPDELPVPAYKREHSVVMFAGRFDRVRGADMYLSIAKTLLDDDINAEFWMCGYGSEDELNRIKQRAESFPDGFMYFGTLPWEDYRKRLVSADILVNLQNPDHPISEYTFPSKLLDFMASNSVVVSTDMSDIAESLENEVIIGERTNKPIKNILVKLIQGEQLGQEMYRTNAEQWVCRNCSNESVGDRILDVVRNTTQ